MGNEQTPAFRESKFQKPRVSPMGSLLSLLDNPGTSTHSRKIFVVAAALTLTNFKCLHTLADEASAIIVPGRVPAPTGWAREGTSSDRARGPSPTLDAHTPCDTLNACTSSRSIVPKVVARRCSKRSGHALRSSRTCLSPPRNSERDASASASAIH